jgi:hypothetical protein
VDVHELLGSRRDVVTSLAVAASSSEASTSLRRQAVTIIAPVIVGRAEARPLSPASARDGGGDARRNLTAERLGEDIS